MISKSDLGMIGGIVETASLQGMIGTAEEVEMNAGVAGETAVIAVEIMEGVNAQVAHMRVN